MPTPDLDSCLREAKKIPDNTYFRLNVMRFDKVPWVATMKKNEHYFPTRLGRDARQIRAGSFSQRPQRFSISLRRRDVQILDKAILHPKALCNWSRVGYLNVMNSDLGLNISHETSLTAPSPIL
jgi:hypothetical protein